MEKTIEHTPTELLKLVTDIKSRHDNLKTEILELLTNVETIEETINQKLKELDDTEKKYVHLMEKMTKIK